MPPRPSSSFERALERIAVAHTGILLVATTWGFGGNAAWIRPWLAAWGSLSLPLILAARWAQPRSAAAPILRWLWPLGLFNALALAACLTPGFRAMADGADVVLIPLRVPAWRPSAALPSLVLPNLWIFDAVYLAAFNLALAVRGRRLWRGFFLCVTANAVALAVFGTLQKLSGASGLYFGLVKSPQSYFFASFIYDNHWGAFIVLMTAATLGLVGRYAARSPADEFFRTPAFAGLVAILFLVATVPLSGARVCTALLFVLLTGGYARAMNRMIKSRRRNGEPVARPLAGTLFAAALALAAIWSIAGENIAQRFAKTQEQVALMRAQGGIGNRSALYANTWRMAKDRLWFGWGTGSYPHVFTLYNTQQPNPLDHLPVFYHDAHSDWLQSLAEHGLVGTLLLGLCAVIPLAAAGARHLAAPLPCFLLAGCALVFLYAAIEFPFGNVAVVLSWWLCFFGAIRYAQLRPTAPVRPS
jgi:O-antigen ligase